MKLLKKAIISGGGSGGHVFPAIAIANELKAQFPGIDILFVGAEGRMEMEKVPQAGYRIKALPIAGFQRSNLLANLSLPLKIVRSLLIARRILIDFQPDVVIGVGGYASGPTLKMSNMLGIPTFIQEQNSFPGKTNRMLASKAKKIFTAYEGMEKYFPREKIILSGNPVRQNMVEIEGKREQAFTHFDLDPNKKTVLVLGGSLGAKTLNDSMDASIETLSKNGIQIIWQCGKFYADQLFIKWKGKLPAGVWLNPFIFDMDYAYAAADLIVSRAGAISVSELCLVGKPVILVPSPHVAEDHQTKNALALVEKDACILIKDSEARKVMLSVILDTLNDPLRCAQLGTNIKKLGLPYASKTIVEQIALALQ
jgi:UDP-N-acetylglucosamine--N-acetylmuramyl-(pentapeptide) pyrophosphoryl-undecaprenol N-acetylglucosamine transferase